MLFFRVLLASCTLLTLTGWFWLHRPYSPSQSLPPVSFVAFQLHTASPGAGASLAEAVRTWPGITASSYSPTSDLLAVGFTAASSALEIQQRIEALVPYRVAQKTFTRPVGPQCPVPRALTAKIPPFLLSTALVSFILLCFSWVSGFRRPACSG